MNLNDRSQRNLLGVHPSLVKVVRRAAEIVDGRGDGLGFVVTEGLRTVMRQSELVKAGASKTMNSKHLTGHAVDLAATVGGDVRWDWPCFFRLAEVMREAANAAGVEVKWGGSWLLLSSMTGAITARSLSKSFPDGPHFELDPQEYP